MPECRNCGAPSYNACHCEERSDATIRSLVTEGHARLCLAGVADCHDQSADWSRNDRDLSRGRRKNKGGSVTLPYGMQLDLELSIVHCQLSIIS